MVIGYLDQLLEDGSSLVVLGIGLGVEFSSALEVLLVEFLIVLHLNFYIPTIIF